MTRPRMRPSDVATALWPAVLLVGLGTAGFVGLLDWVNEKEDLSLLDEPLLEWLAAHRTPGLSSFMTVVTTLFGPVVLPLVVAGVALLWWRVSRSWWHPALLVAAMALSSALTLVLKAAVGRSRPLADLMAIPGYETSGSFPSGHTIGAATLVLVGGYLLWHEDADASWRLTAWTVLSFAIVGTVALSRLYLGYHFLTDVLAGACVGVAVLGVVVGIERWRDLALERRDPPERPRPLADDDAVLPWPGPGAPDDAGDEGTDVRHEEFQERLPWVLEAGDQAGGESRVE